MCSKQLREVDERMALLPVSGFSEAQTNEVITTYVACARETEK